MCRTRNQANIRVSVYQDEGPASAKALKWASDWFIQKKSRESKAVRQTDRQRRKEGVERGKR